MRERDATFVLWVAAISQGSSEFAFRNLGVCLWTSIMIHDNAEPIEEAINLEFMDDWLTILDDADDHEVGPGGAEDNSKPFGLSYYLSCNDNGAILFTTRSRKVAGALTPSSIFGLHDLTQADAKQLLKRRIVKQALLDDETAVDELLDDLTCLPLAIVQAAAFIDNNDVSASEYLSLFQRTNARTELFNESFHDPSRYEELDSTVAKTWHISFDQMRKQDPLATEYLSFMACIDRVNIPLSLLPSGATMVQQTKALGTLTGYAFVSERPRIAQQSGTDRYFDMHRLVHLASICWLDTHDGRADWNNTAVSRLEELVPYGGYENKEVWMAYLPHAIHVAESYNMVNNLTGTSLLERVGCCQADLGQYSAAGTTQQAVLVVRTKLLGEEHPDTLTSTNHVAYAIYRQGRDLEAEDMFRKNLRLREKVLGYEHPDALISMRYVAGMHGIHGRYVEAWEMHCKVLRLSKKVLGDDHQQTLRSMNKLARALLDRGKYVEAEEMFCETLSLQKRVLGEEHSDTLASMCQLAWTLGRQEKYVEAEETYTRVLALWKKVLGDKHPDTLMSMSQLAWILVRQEKYAEAEEICTKVLALEKKVLGDKHPDTLWSMCSLAWLLADQLCYDEARSLFEQACAGYGSVFGEDHPETRDCRRNYRQILAWQEQYQRLRSEEPASGCVDKRPCASKIPILSRKLASTNITRSRNHVK